MHCWPVVLELEVDRLHEFITQYFCPPKVTLLQLQVSVNYAVHIINMMMWGPGN